jgi:predicted amidophosphoribosyltransferase
LGAYKGALRKAILLYKFHQDPLALQFLRKKSLDFHLPQPDINSSVWTYIPSHKKRIKERGGRGQHLTQILKNLQQQHNRPMQELLSKDQKRRPQIELNEKERRAQMDLSLRYTGPENPPETVFLFDDVWTTGTTLSSAARVLKQAGVKKVFVFTLAFNDLQTPKKSHDTDR